MMSESLANNQALKESNFSPTMSTFNTSNKVIDQKIIDIKEQIDALVAKIKPEIEATPITFFYQTFEKGRVMVNGQKTVAGEVVRSGKHLGLCREVGKLSAIKEILRLIRAKFFPDMISPVGNLDKYEHNLLQFCKIKKKEPQFSSDMVDGKYNVTLTIGSFVSYSGPTKSMKKAKDIAAMNWLWLFGEDWQQILYQKNIDNQIYASSDKKNENQGTDKVKFNLDENTNNLKDLSSEILDKHTDNTEGNEDKAMYLSQECSDFNIDESFPEFTAPFKFSNTAIQDNKPKDTAVLMKPKSRNVKKLNKQKASNNFEYSDDEDVIEILNKQKEVKDMKAKKGFKLVEKIQKMPVSTKHIVKHNMVTRKRTKRFSNEFETSETNPQKGNLKPRRKKKSKTEIDLGEILKLPNQHDVAKSKELDEMDNLIAERQCQHEQEMEQLDKDIAAAKKIGTDKKIREKANALLRNRLQTELTEPLLREMFRSNIEYLNGIWNGHVESSRHDAYHRSIKSRHDIYYAIITDPFTDEQLDWTLDEIGKLWMRNRKEEMDNKEYCWKVILSECFIKLYGDFFNFTKQEAIQRISETPLHKVDRLKEFMDKDESSGTD